MDSVLKELESNLRIVVGKLTEELRSVRSNRPSVDILETVTVMYYDQPTPINQLGSISIQPPRDILISIWDKAAVGPVMKGIEDAKIGLRATNDGNTVRVYLPSLTDERREELSRLVKKMVESYRIQVRAHRDDAMKKIKAGEADGVREDEARVTKEKVEKSVKDANEKIEQLLGGKLREISE